MAAATIFSNYTWETCAMTESEMAVNAIKSQAVEGDKALVMADLIQVGEGRWACLWGSWERGKRRGKEGCRSVRGAGGRGSQE